MNNNYEFSMINGNSIDVKPQKGDSEIKADIVVSEFNSVRIWGQIVNCNGEPVPNALIKLIRVSKDNYDKESCYYQGIAHTVSDCQGFYQFDINADSSKEQFKILVGKSATGTERVINPNTGNCNACSTNDYAPVSEYAYRVTPPDKFNCQPKPNVIKF